MDKYVPEAKGNKAQGNPTLDKEYEAGITENAQGNSQVSESDEGVEPSCPEGENPFHWDFLIGGEQLEETNKSKQNKQQKQLEDRLEEVEFDYDYEQQEWGETGEWGEPDQVC